MTEPDEEALLASLDIYKQQLNQVEESLREDTVEANFDVLNQLRDDLCQLIQLTEESVVSLKKSRLLSLLESSTNSTAQVSTGSPTQNDIFLSSSSRSEMDEEFEKFQAALGQCSNGSRTTNKNDETGDVDIDAEEKDEEEELGGMRCQAPYSHDWGEMSYHNAIVLCEEEGDASDDMMVRVVFCNPTHCSMRPCPYFMEDKCRFSDSECRFSHGHLVSFTDLKPFVEPDHSKVVVGCHCLAKDDDEVWYKATIVEIVDDEKVKVEYNANGCVATVKLHEILPLNNEEDAFVQDADQLTSDDDDVDEGDDDDDDKIKEKQTLPGYMLCPQLQTTDAMGLWEEHTKGIGSKLMLKMGYIIGQGLGKNADGRALPVPIQLLPQGKSLDQIMEMKEKARNGDLFQILKKQKRRQNAINKDASKSFNRPKTKSVFDFINTRLYKKKGKQLPTLGKDCHSSNKPTKKATVISTHELSKRSDTHINVQLLKTGEEIKNANLEIGRLTESLHRNLRNKDEVTAKKMEHKIQNLQEYVQQLRTSEKFMHQQQNNRKAHKDLVKF